MLTNLILTLHGLLTHTIVQEPKIWPKFTSPFSLGSRNETSLIYMYMCMYVSTVEPLYYEPLKYTSKNTSQIRTLSLVLAGYIGNCTPV